MAYAPDLRGCMADGDTPEAALRDLLSAIEEWIDEAGRLGRDIPAPGVCGEEAHKERADLIAVLDAQEQLIQQQDASLKVAREELDRIRGAISSSHEHGGGPARGMYWADGDIPGHLQRSVRRNAARLPN